MDKYYKKVNLVKDLFELFQINDWKFEWSVDTECDNEMKVIRMSHNYKNEPIYYFYESLVHEIAHIGQKEICSKTSHNSEFYLTYANLLLDCVHILDKYL